MNEIAKAVLMKQLGLLSEESNRVVEAASEESGLVRHYERKLDPDAPLMPEALAKLTHELAQQLEYQDLADEPLEHEITATPPTWMRKRWWILAAITTLLVLGGVALTLLRSQPAPNPVVPVQPNPSNEKPKAEEPQLPASTEADLPDILVHRPRVEYTNSNLAGGAISRLTEVLLVKTSQAQAALIVVTEDGVAEVRICGTKKGKELSIDERFELPENTSTTLSILVLFQGTPEEIQLLKELRASILTVQDSRDLLRLRRDKNEKAIAERIYQTLTHNPFVGSWKGKIDNIQVLPFPRN